MPPPARCPSDAELAAFYEGSLPTEAHLRTARHLRVCAACRSRAGVRPVPAPPPPLPPPPQSNDPTAEHEVTLPERLPPADPTAEQIGPYRLVRLIGRGGMGSVYEAVHDRLGRKVALKVLPVLAARDARYVDRFQREARTVGKLDHPNVVKATDAGESAGVPFLAMELVDGVDVARLVRAVGPLPVSDTAEVVRQAATGLAHAHGKGVIHRDVKPSNLMVTVDGTVKILDLGLALSREPSAGDPPSGTALLGTHDYMAPEQWTDSSAVGPPADVYGLGCVLYQALAGRPPFTGVKHATPRAKQYAHQHTDPPPVPNRDDIPGPLLALLRRMLAKSPAERPTAARVAEVVAPLVGVVQLPRLVERAKLAPISGFSDGEPTNAAPLHADTGSRGSSSVVLTVTPGRSVTTTELPTLPATDDDDDADSGDRPPPRPRLLFATVLGLLAVGGVIVVWAVARTLRGSP